MSPWAKNCPQAQKFGARAEGGQISFMKIISFFPIFGVYEKCDLNVKLENFLTRGQVRVEYSKTRVASIGGVTVKGKKFRFAPPQLVCSDWEIWP